MRNPRSIRVSGLPILFVAACMLGACDDPFAAFLQDVPEEPVEATLFDFVSGRLEDPPAFDMLNGGVARVDLTSNWDFLFRIENGEPQFAPFSVVTDSVTDAGLQTSAQPFAAIREAPPSGYDITRPTAIGVGDVLLVRSRADPTQGLLCSRFAKIEILEIDLVAGSVTFQFLRNPNCGDVVLEPGTHGDP